MSGAIEEHAANVVRLKEAAASHYAVASSPYSTQAERAAAAQPFAQAGAAAAASEARVAAANVVAPPVSDAKFLGWFPDAQDPETRAGLLALGRDYGAKPDYLRMSWDEKVRLDQIKERGGDPEAEALRMIHGALGKDAPAALAAAKALVGRDPKLRDFLAETGLGNSAWMVRHLAAEARKRGIAR